MLTHSIVSPVLSCMIGIMTWKILDIMLPTISHRKIRNMVLCVILAFSILGSVLTTVTVTALSFAIKLLS